MGALPGHFVQAITGSDGTKYELRRIPHVFLQDVPGQRDEVLWALYQRLDKGLLIVLAGTEGELVNVATTVQRDATSLPERGRILGLPVIDSQRPAALSTVDIAKPWGKEVWYTGIEARGVSAVSTLGADCPLTWWLAAMPAELSGLSLQEAPILLKILAPHNEAVLGDLYFELHEIKREVYVISAVSEAAWPNGTGAIRIGFNAEKRAAYKSDKEFKRAYTDVVEAYRQVRYEVDDWLLENNLQAADPCNVDSVKIALEQVPQRLQRTEKQRREAMEAFTQLHPIRVGDVVVIPRNLPHSLQHGVRAVEFQTPVYERKIVSFAQRVLTQAHWDTEQAMRVTDMRDYRAACFKQQPCGEGFREKIVDFDDFTVWRYSIVAGGSVLIGEDHARYLLLMALVGKVYTADCQLHGEQAALIPAALLPGEIQNKSAETAIVLVAMPN